MPLRVTGKGNALRFDGVDDYVEVPHHASLMPAEITVEAWIYARSFSGAPYIVNKAYSGDGGYNIRCGTDGRLIFAVMYELPGTWYAPYSTFLLDTDTWYHVVGTYKQGDLCCLYVNGDLEDDVSSPEPMINNTRVVELGTEAHAAHWLNGIIDEVRIYNRALSAQEVKEHYNGVFRDESGLVLYLPFGEGRSTRTLDRSPYNNHGTIHGAEWVNKVTGGLDFDGVDDYVRVSDSDTLDVKRITIEAWAHPRGWPGAYNLGLVLFKYQQYYLRGAEGSLAFYVNTDVDAYTLGYPHTWALDKWYHWVAVYDGESMIIYVNGIQVASQPASGDILGGAQDLRIGEVYGQAFNGFMDEVRIYNRVLSAEEILARFKGQEIGRTGLVLDLPFSECEGTITKDRSGYGNDGSISGAEWVVKRNTRLLAATRTLAPTR